MDKEPTQQLTIPLTTNPTEFKSVVKQHWNVTFARQRKISVYAKRIMALVIAQIQDNDLALKPFYQMHITDIVRESNVNRHTAYKEVKKALKELMVQIWEFEDLASKRYTPKHIVDTTKVISEDGFEYGYDNGTITIVLNPALKPYFLELGHYTTYGLLDYMQFRSWYSMRIYEILEAHRDTGKYYVNIDEYRTLMDCNDKYPLNKDLINKTLKEPLEELEGTKMAFIYKPVYPQKKQKGRPPIVALEFTLKKKELKKIPKHWLKDERAKSLIDQLLAFQVTEKNIAKYGGIIPLSEASQMIRAWQIKEQSNKRIDNKRRYCNAVWVRTGKKYAEQSKD